MTLLPPFGSLPQLARAARSRLGLGPRLVRRSILGHTYVVREGTIRSRSDYDDAWLVACAGEARIIADVGSNAGYTALLCLSLPNVQQMILIEANPEALSIAAENLIRNGLSANTRFINAFADERCDETVRFWAVKHGAAGSIYAIHSKTAHAQNRSIAVPTTTLDAICECLDVVPDLVKVDVEGAEYRVLQGSRECASRLRTRFFVEMHSNPELSMRQNAQSVIEWGRSSGYEAWYLKEKIRLESPEQIEHRGRCHLLLQPASWSFPEALRTIPQSGALPTERAESVG